MEKINGYELTAPLTSDNSGFGRWGFAHKNGREYFIKEFLSPVYPLNTSLFSGSEMEQRVTACNQFVQKKQQLYNALNRCAGGNIVKIADFFRFGPKYYIVTEKVNVVRTSPEEVYRAFNFSAKVLLAKVICYNVKLLHDNGIVHADLKPGNILIQKTAAGFYTAKIIDFDSSFLESQYIARDELEGDPVYLAPEVFGAMNGSVASLSTKVDVFSLGVLFYQVFFGTLPQFGFGNQGYTFELVGLGKQVLFPNNVNKYLKKMIEGMLQKDPKKRWDLNKVYAYLEKM